MIEKKTMWYYDFAYPEIEPKIASVYVNTDTNKVEVYNTEGDTYTATTNDRFYNTKVEAFDAMAKRIQELKDMMPTIKDHLNALSNCENDDGKVLGHEYNDFLGDYGHKVRRYQRYDCTRKEYNDVDTLADLLTDLLRTGFLNVKADSFRRDDVEQIKWGSEHAEAVLKNGKLIKTSNISEYWLLERVFGRNHSSFNYKYLSKEKE